MCLALDNLHHGILGEADVASDEPIGEGFHSLTALAPNIDLHHFIKSDAILAPVVELGGAGGGMRRHLACLLECAAVLEVGCDAGSAEGVVADPGCIATHHGVQLGMGMAVRCAT
jgi:hypothetical protein